MPELALSLSMSWNNFNSCSRDFSTSSLRKLIISFVGSFFTASRVVSSFSLLDFPFFTGLLGTNSSAWSSTLSAVLSSRELQGVHGGDDEDLDGSKARSGWHESLVFTTSNKALNHLPNPRSSWYLFIPVVVFWVRAACLHWLTHFLNLLLIWLIVIVNLSPLADALSFNSSMILA